EGAGGAAEARGAVARRLQGREGRRREGVGRAEGAEEVEPRLLVGDARRRRRTPKGAARLPDPALTPRAWPSQEAGRWVLGRWRQRSASLNINVISPFGMVYLFSGPRISPLLVMGQRPETFPLKPRPLDPPQRRRGGRFSCRFQHAEVVGRNE